MPVYCKLVAAALLRRWIDLNRSVLMKVSPLDLADPMLAQDRIMRSKPKRPEIAASDLRHATLKGW